MGHRAAASVSLWSLAAFLLPAARAAEERAEPPREGRSLVLLPVPSYTPDTGVAVSVGGMFWETGSDPDGRSSVAVHCTHTENEQTLVQAVPDLYLAGGDVNLRGAVAYEEWPSLYYGLGPDAPESAAEEYVESGSLLRLSVSWRIRGGLWLGGRLVYEDLDVLPEPGGSLESEGLTGGDGAVASGLGVQLVLDTRDDVILPTSGWHVRLTETFFDESLGSTQRFSVSFLDARRYVSARRSDVFAFRLSARAARGEVPFQQLSTLGGEDLMRGYPWGRLRDDACAVLQAEYRFRADRRLGAAAFVGLGGVGDSLGDLETQKFRLAGGVGLRCRLGSDASATARADVAFTEEGTAVYLSLGEAF